MTYIEKAKYIMDNYNFCTYQKPIRYNGMNVADPSTYFWRLFTPEFYKIPDTNKTFHNSDYVKFLSEYEYKDEFSIETCLQGDKKIILQMDLHPCTENNKPFEVIKNKFFDFMLGKNYILKNMQSGKMTMFLYQGWEAENYTISHWPDDKYKTFLDMIESVLQQYNLPYSSIVILNSNVRLHNYKHKVNVIYDNAMEMNSFKRGVSAHGDEFGINQKDFDETFTIDEYLKTIRTNTKRLLRLSRTPHELRDKMLYFTHLYNFQDKSLFEHRYFNIVNVLKNSQFFHLTKEFCEENKFYDLVDNFDLNKIDENLLNNIDKQKPFIASPYENKEGYHKFHHHSNSPIPFDVYRETIFSWVSTSLPDQEDKVFLNQSTFNPILHYHPIIWNGQKHTVKWFKHFGFKSYEWLFENETRADNEEHIFNRFVLNMQDIIRVMNMSDDELYNKIKDNKDTLQHNKDLLFECKSIERIITKFYETTI